MGVFPQIIGESYCREECSSNVKYLKLNEVWKRLIYKLRMKACRCDNVAVLKKKKKKNLEARKRKKKKEICNTLEWEAIYNIVEHVYSLFQV